MDSARRGEAPRPAVRVSRKAQRRLLVLGLVGLDALMLAAGVTAAYLFRFYVPLPIFQEVIPEPGYYALLAAAMIPMWLGLFALVGLYSADNLLGGTREYALAFNACTVGTLLNVLTAFLSERLIISRGLLMLIWGFAFLAVGAGRFAFRRGVYRLRRRGYFVSPAAIVGANAEGVALAEQLDLWAASGMRLAGFVDDERPAGEAVGNGLVVLGGVDDLPRLIEEHGLEELVVATAGVPRQRLVELVQSYGTSEQVDIHFSSGLFEILTTGVQVRERAYVPLIALNKVRLTGMDRFLKGALDLATALPLTALLLPALGLIALAIKLDSPGPAIYRRRVLGLHGREFDAWKFRTMDADWRSRPQGAEVREQFVNGLKPRDDPRVTRVGQWLRRWSLDELPQLLNVLRREMSLVGPRMITQEEMPLYHKWAMNLLTIRPGMTGLWQVSGRAEVSYEEKVRLDMFYIRNYTIWLDLQILMRTLSVVLRGRGAR